MTEEKDISQMNDEELKKLRRREYLEVIFLVILAIAVSLLIVQYVGQRTVVRGSSMVPTLHDGDQLVVYKFLYQYKEPQKGDIVVVWVPPEKRIEMSENLYIKRVIATSGDKIAVRNRTVFLNGKPLEEPFTNKQPGMYIDFPETVVPTGYAFVMGDNRGNSRDSRELGFISNKDIKGKAIFRFFPFKDFGKLK